jgi:hypothetical protein
MARGATGGSRYSRGRLIEVKRKRVREGGVKPGFNCPLMVAIEGGEVRETQGNGRRARSDAM